METHGPAGFNSSAAAGFVNPAPSASPLRDSKGSSGCCCESAAWSRIHRWEWHQEGDRAGAESPGGAAQISLGAGTESLEGSAVISSRAGTEAESPGGAWRAPEKGRTDRRMGMCAQSLSAAPCPQGCGGAPCPGVLHHTGDVRKGRLIHESMHPTMMGLSCGTSSPSWSIFPCWGVRATPHPPAASWGWGKQGASLTLVSPILLGSSKQQRGAETPKTPWEGLCVSPKLPRAGVVPLLRQAGWGGGAAGA